MAHSKAQAQATTAKAQATAAAAKAQLASLPAKLTFYAGVVKFRIQVAVMVVSGAGACATCKAWEVRKLKHQHASTTNVDLEAVYIAINQDLSKAKQGKAKQSKAKQAKFSWSTPTLPNWARTAMHQKKRQPQRQRGVRSRAINQDREGGQ